MPPRKAWGTITRSRYKLGYQKLTDFELEQSVERLYHAKTKQVRQWWPSDHKHKRVEATEVAKIVDRLYKNSGTKASDSQRVPQGRIRNMGIVNSFAWKGYN